MNGVWRRPGDWITCPACGGVNDDDCNRCNGGGMVVRTRCAYVFPSRRRCSNTAVRLGLCYTHADGGASTD